MSEGPVTELLIEWSHGDKTALDRLMPLVYAELRNVARHRLSLEPPGSTLQPTAVVHEAYLRLIDQDRVEWRNRAHFFAISASMIRRILLDHARQRHAAKRGGLTPKISLEMPIASPDKFDPDMLALDGALNELAQMDEQQARVIELRFFTGLNIDETAEVLGISTATVNRDWVTAKAWLYHKLNCTERPAGSAE
jgi:RNA polymerase sigma factor (TIGR02999 family)